jgi:hypothetical protein
MRRTSRLLASLATALLLASVVVLISISAISLVKLVPSRDPYKLTSMQVSGTRKENLNRLRARLRQCLGAECRVAEGG